MGEWTTPNLCSDSSHNLPRCSVDGAGLECCSISVVCRYGMHPDEGLVQRVVAAVFNKRLSLKQVPQLTYGSFYIPQAFQQMDVDGSGKLTEEEFSKALKAFDVITDPVARSGSHSSLRVEQEIMSEFMKALDRDGDNEIDYDEFFYAFSVVRVRLE